jgi:hypothetical protein
MALLNNAKIKSKYSINKKALDLYQVPYDWNCNSVLFF